MQLKAFTTRLKRAFTLENTICRLLASWCLFVLGTLSSEGSFTKLAFSQDIPNTSMLFTIACGFILFTTVRALVPSFIETDSIALLLSSGACTLRWAYDAEDAKNEMLFTLALICVFSLFFFYCYNKNKLLLKKIPLPDSPAFAAVVVISVVSGGVIAMLGVCRYLSFATPNFDFGLFCNMFHYMKETGLPLATSERDVLMSHFGVHISPIYYLLLPLYYIFPSPVTLQISQALVLATGTFAVWLLARHRGLGNKVSVLLCALYAFFPALSGGCFYDLHENCFLAPLLLWTFYFFEKEKYIPAYVFTLLTLAVKEDAAVYIVIFAIFLVLSKKKYLHGAIVGGVAIVWFVAALAILENVSGYYAELYANDTPKPAIAGPMINRFNNLILNSEEGLVGALLTLIKNPGYALTQLFTDGEGGYKKLWYTLLLLLPLGAIPLLTKKPSRWLLLAPLLTNLLTNYQYQYDIGFQYSFGITAFLIYAVILNIGDIKEGLRFDLLGAAAVCTALLYVSNVLPFAVGYYQRYEKGKDYYAGVESILDTLPEDASLCVSSFLLAHVADRDEVYELNYHGKDADVDYVVFDLRYSVDESTLLYYLQNGYEQTEKHEGKLLILKKTAE